MATVVIATKNEKKLRELKRYLRGVDATVLSLKSFPGSPNIREDGKTFIANAVKKAVGISRFTRTIAIADDSGLVVDALGGKPGVRSARFAGTHKDDSDNCAKVLRLMRAVPMKKRGASFVCAVAVAENGRTLATIEGKCRGRIAYEARGRYGFGYDPLFLIPKRGKTFGELGLKVKDKMSHRSKALAKARLFFREHLS